MTRERILALDVGTSGVKAVITDRTGRLLDSAYRAYGIETGPNGWVDQDIEAIIAASCEAIRALTSAVARAGDSITGVSVTAQMFNLVAVDADGRALLPMISWLDQRAEPDARSLALRMPPAEQFVRLGAVVSGKDILPKILWLRYSRPDVFERTAYLLDCKEAVVMRMTGRAVIDYGGAAAFRLFDRAARQWDEGACAATGVPWAKLPDVEPATAIAGGITTAFARESGLVAGTPVVVGAGDVAASQVGAGAAGVGDAHVSLGTAVYFGVTLDQPAIDPHGVLGVIGHIDPNLWILWLEIATGGGALAWLGRILGPPDDEQSIDYAEVDALVAGCADEMGSLLFAPWLSGERVPIFDDRARAAFIGLDLRHGRAHLYRAVMEGVAFQMRWALEYGQAFGHPIETIRAVGGGTIGSVWIQIIADILDRPLLAIAGPQDAGAVGAAACALVGLGLQPDFGFVETLAVVEREYVPDPVRRAAYARRYDQFRRLYDALGPIHHPA
jgi:sugar (pentulose or hexulose) kinase